MECYIYDIAQANCFFFKAFWFESEPTLEELIAKGVKGEIGTFSANLVEF